MLSSKYKKSPNGFSNACLLTVMGMCVLGLSASWASEKPGNSQGARQARNAELANVRAATMQYLDVETALIDGYVSTVECASAADEGLPAQVGGMGIHFVKPGRVGFLPIDFTNPGVLVYSPDPTVEHCTYTTGELMVDASCRDSLSLVAVEELVFADQVEPGESGNHWDNVPEYLGQQFYYRHDNPETTWVDEAHGMPPHYELHIWLYDQNPAGLFSQWNPNLSCPSSLSDHH